MLGAYRLPTVTSPLAAMDDARMARLVAAWPTWEAGRHPDGGTMVWPAGLGERPGLGDLGAAHECEDGLVWLPPPTLPTLYDLAREDPPGDMTEVSLRRIGPVSVPLGLGPIYGLGPKRGSPSSVYGRLAHDLRQRARIKDRVWTDADEIDVERLLFLAFQFGYAVTWEIWCHLAPYDLDEVSRITDAIWGLDPKASTVAAAT